ncbi:MAG: arginine--tRNA ligase, partial [bacterium]|nr:arginine--tRNA ligase [bacterium]
MIKDEIENIIRELGYGGFSVEVPADNKFGDYSTNVAMKLGGNPRETAEKIADSIKHQVSSAKLFERIEVAGPGFINFFISGEYLQKELKNILKQKNKYGCGGKGKGKTVVIDYSGVNIAKPFGIGHLRSTIIGQAIYNLHKCLGYKVIGDNHIGDWGTQFGKLIYAIKTWGSEKDIKNYSIKSLLALYVKFHEEAEKNPELKAEGRRWFEKLEKGEKEPQKIWKECVKISLKEFKRIYEMLGVNIDLTLGESFYAPMSKEVVKEAVDRKVAKRSQGALIIEFQESALPPLLIEGSDGATLYATRDLAAIKYRAEKLKADKII